MSKSLVIVESPGKIRTIKRYLGQQFDVKSSVGHVRDLAPINPSPKQARSGSRKRTSVPAKYRRMGLIPNKKWKANYQVISGKESIVKQLKSSARTAEHIYLATDLDREGEAIAWHLRETIGGDKDRYVRVVFNEITQSAIKDAFAKPTSIDEKLVQAQQTRRFLDRVVGFEVSPLLSRKISRGLSAGRVQSVAVKLIVERERAIRVFKPEEYWTVEASLAQYTDPKIQTNDRLLKSVVFQVTKKNNKPFRPRSESEVNSDIASMQEKTFVVSGQTRQLRKVSAPPPLITTTLQRVAASNLGYPVGLTMRLAQRLYESGHITYMRTDSTNLSNESISSVREYISTNIQEPYSKSNRESKHNFLPLKPQHYGSKKTAQEAHEAIRPTDVNLNPTRFPNPSSQEARLYQLIWQRFIASQMSKYEFATYTTTVSAGEYDLSITRRQTIFDGWRKIIPLPQRDDEQPLLERPYDDGEMLACLEVTKKQHFTKPPARFSEARLVKELEDRGIGRPSTYASIISTIKDRGYVTLKGKQFHAERIGEIVTDRLEESFTNLLDYEFTSKLESKLDEIAHGNDDWLSVLDGFYESFSEQLTTAESPDGMQRNSPVKTDINCVKCNGEMLLRVARNGTFLGCENFSAKEPNQCNFTLNLFPDSEFEAIDEAGSEESMRLLEKRPCPICGTGMDPQIIDESRRIHICGNTPNCTGVIVEHGSFKIKGYDGPKVECNKCQSDMQLETGRFGKYFKCSNDECTNTRKLLRNGDVAPVRADPVPMPELTCEKNPDHFVLREGGAGIFLAASQYPRHRETRAPLIRELKGHGNRLDPKFKYLLNAPEADSKGNPSQVRWSRKFGEQYLSSEKKGKDTGWRAYFQEGRWVVIEPKRKSRSKAKAAA